MAETIDIRELNERIERQSAFVTNLTTGMDQVIVGQFARRLIRGSHDQSGPLARSHVVRHGHGRTARPARSDRPRRRNRPADDRIRLGQTVRRHLLLQIGRAHV